MSEQALLEAIREIVPEKAEDIRNRAQQIDAQPPTLRKPLPSLLGIFKHLNFDVSEEDIAEMRREAYKNFPRDFPED